MLAATVHAAPATLAFHADATVAGAHVSLADIADLTALPRDLRQDAGGLPIAAFGIGQDRLTLSDPDVAARARALMPTLARWLPAGQGTVVVIRKPPAPAASRAARCVRVLRSLAAGTLAARADFAASACPPATPRGAFRYDLRVRDVRTARALNEGDVVAAPPSSRVADVQPGQQLYIEASVGPVVVRRAVQAIQPGRAGGSLFVQASDGTIFSAPAPEADR